MVPHPKPDDQPMYHVEVPRSCRDIAMMGGQADLDTSEDVYLYALPLFYSITGGLF